MDNFLVLFIVFSPSGEITPALAFHTWEECEYAVKYSLSEAICQRYDVENSVRPKPRPQHILKE